MQYTELQKRLSQMKNDGAVLTCRVTSARAVLEAEYQRLTSEVEIIETTSENIEKVDDRNTRITVLRVTDENTVIAGINGEHHIIKVYWDDERDTAISINREVIVTAYADSGVVRNQPICKVEFIGDTKGNYRAFPMTRLEGRCEWLYPSAETRYHSIKARIHALDIHSKIVEIEGEHQYPTIVRSRDICIIRMLDDIRCGITKYYPSTCTFQLIGRRWLPVDSSTNMQWIGTVQDVRKHFFPLGTKVYLQHDIGKLGRLDLYRVDKLFYTHLCLMAQCTNERTQHTEILPVVQLHLPQTVRQ